MNKYSSKAVKTAATVGMSLAMVLSAAAPVFAAQNDDTSICTTTVTKEQLGLLNQFRSNNSDWAKAKANTTFNAKKVTVFGSKFDKDGTAISSAATSVADTTYPATIKVGNTELKLVWDSEIVNEDKKEAGKSYFYATTVDGNVDVVVTETVKVNMITYMAGKYSEDANVVTTATKVGDIIIPTGKSSTFNEALKAINTNCYDSGDNAFKVNASAMLKLVDAVSTTNSADLIKLAMDDADNDADAVENIQKFLDKYTSNLSAEQKGILEDAIYEKTPDTDTNEYQTGLSKFLDKVTGAWEDKLTASSVTKISGGTAITNSEIEAFIDDVVKADAVYTQYKRDEAVVDFIAEVESAKDDVKAVIDAVSKSKNDSYKEYLKGTTSVKVKVNTYLKLDDGEVSVVESKSFTSADYAILKAFKEDVVDVVMTMESKEVGSRYLDKSTKSPYATSTQVEAVLDIFGGLNDLADTETGDFYWDVLEAHMEGLATALKAVTTDIEKITPANIKSTDKATLVAAEDALYELQKGDYSQNLTKDEAKEVRAAEAKITNLREAFDNLGTTAVAGWYDMGNGNWGYNNEDGTPAAYKWVASGADWYMIKDGKMLRNTWLATDGGRWYYLDNAGKMVTNQSVDGCWINSYGVYMSPSYNG